MKHSLQKLQDRALTDFRSTRVHFGCAGQCRAVQGLKEKDRESTTEIPFLCDSLCMSLDHYGSMYVSFDSFAGVEVVG